MLRSTFHDISGSAIMLGQVDDWAELDEQKQARPSRNPFASRSVRRALLTPRVKSRVTLSLR